MPLSNELELCLVMPVYNEGECIQGVVESWLDVLDREVGQGRFRLLVLNDGSKDDTAAKLATFAADPRVEAVDKPNSGHGPTILLGYRRATAVADWVFQVDSDDEMRAEDFGRVWSVRQGASAVFGYRDGRRQNLARKLISAGSRFAVRLVFGRSRVSDVNTPFRLMQSKSLAPLLSAIPDDTFAPNVLIAGGLSVAPGNVLNVGVPHHDRETGTVSIVKWKLWKMAFRAFRQTVAAAAGVKEQARLVNLPGS